MPTRTVLSLQVAYFILNGYGQGLGHQSRQRCHSRPIHFIFACNGLEASVSLNPDSATMQLFRLETNGPNPRTNGPYPRTRRILVNYFREHTKNFLMECMASHLKHKKFTTDFGGRLNSTGGRILQSIPGTELYRERLVRALAWDLQVPVLVLDSGVLAPYDFNEDESESDEEKSESEIEDENDASNEEDYTSDGSDDELILMSKS